MFISLIKYLKDLIESILDYIIFLMKCQEVVMLFYFNKYLQKTFKVNPGAEGYGIILMHSQYSDCRGANPQLVTISQVSDTCNIFEGTKEAALNRLAELRILYPHLSYHLIKYTVLED